ncbi:MAG: RloB domain-containing protein [Sphingobacteriaceae bacterium]|nr:MAG: RloB domain-containing protein [Sphingobacteriaceae bacterium]
MPRPRLPYIKRAPFKKATLFVVICEGQNREPEYFRFFEEMSSRVKIVPVPSVDGNSSPIKLIANAVEIEEELGVSSKDDQVWFVIDTDRWRTQIHELRNECDQHPHWQVAQSNPCFEVWLYYHVKDVLPELAYMHECNNWKPLLHRTIRNGIDLKNHPIVIETAIINSKATCIETGYLPEPGSTQLWRLGEALLPFIQEELDEAKGKFTKPELLG